MRKHGFFSNSDGLWARRLTAGRHRARAAAALEFGLEFGVSGLGFGGLPWPPNLKGGSGAVAEPAVVVGCGRNGGRRRRRPSGWWRRPVGPVCGGGRHGGIPGEAGLARWRPVVADSATEAAGDRVGGRGGGAAHRR
jgi:hypothetical protein